MDASVIQIIGTIFVALITSLFSWLAIRSQEKRLAKKDQSDNANTISDAALKLLEPYKQEVAELRKKVDDLECDLLKEREKRRELEALNIQKDAKITEMQAEIDDLRSQVEALQKGRRK